MGAGQTRCGGAVVPGAAIALGGAVGPLLSGPTGRVVPAPLPEAIGEERREGLAGGIGVEIGQGVDDERVPPLGVRQDDAAVQPAHAGADEEALAHEVRGEAEAPRRVVVPGGQDDPGPLRQAPQGLIEEGHRVIGRDGAVIHVPGDDDRVDPLGGDEPDEMIGEGGVSVIEDAAVEGPAQMPVRGVQDPHGHTLSRATDMNPPCSRRADRPLGVDAEPDQAATTPVATRAAMTPPSATR
ncbi:Uncharacterised protein [Actinomyces denticolens]|nr:Uncharacterised protein [Actinomyces denticolens]